MRSTASTLVLGLVATAVLASLAFAVPNWLLFLSTMATAHGVVILGLVYLMRGGVVSFGQGLVFAAGGYAASMLATRTGLSDAILLVIAGGVAAALIALPFAPLLSRYRAIFFAMLTLALSMVLFGILVKSEALGGSDGFNVAKPTLFGMALDADNSTRVLYIVAVVFAGLLAIAARIHFDSVRGLVALAIRENELRVEYLGASVRRQLAVDYVIAAFHGGAGGALAALSLGHIEPNFSYWTTSGEFVFAAILAGHHSVVAVFVASFVLEMVRSFSNLYFPNSWQMALGLFLLVIIRFLPQGIGWLWRDRRGGSR
jgi:ABC-type branched-subunit amino acid transport system permease subunit